MRGIARHTRGNLYPSEIVTRSFCVSPDLDWGAWPPISSAPGPNWPRFEIRDFEMKDKLPSESSQAVHSWYGLPAEIAVENELWHLVRVAGVPLNHPPAVNLVLRRGLPRKERLYLSYLHEFGHLQTLPVALLHAALLLTRGGWRKGKFFNTLKGLVMVWIAHEAVWELASESFVVWKAGREYRRIYQDHPNPAGQLAFWATMVGLASLLTSRLLRPSQPK